MNITFVTLAPRRMLLASSFDWPLRPSSELDLYGWLTFAALCQTKPRLLWEDPQGLVVFLEFIRYMSNTCGFVCIRSIVRIFVINKISAKQTL